jgi:hypothetical protein
MELVESRPGGNGMRVTVHITVSVWAVRRSGAGRGAAARCRQRPKRTSHYDAAKVRPPRASRSSAPHMIRFVAAAQRS